MPNLILLGHMIQETKIFQSFHHIRPGKTYEPWSTANFDPGAIMVSNKKNFKDFHYFSGFDLRDRANFGLKAIT